MNGMLSVAVLVAAGIAMLEMSEGGIPNIAQRMVPTWWGRVPETRKECFSAWDCGPYECCVRPITSQNAYCQARKKEGAFCHRASFWADKDREVYFNSCPCLDHYICADLDTQQRCAHPDRLGDRYYIKKLLGHESDK